jgi:ParB family transcriptional regulator, chromosome partitioning protein
MNNTLFNQTAHAPRNLSNEWYTQAKYIEAAREVMHGRELDPASCAMANTIVRATRYYTLQEDGLQQDWNVESLWLNPPFGSTNGKSNMATWSRRLMDDYARGIVKQAILLCMANTEGSWFLPLWSYPLCFPCPRVFFRRPGGTLDLHVQGTCFVSFGPDSQQFVCMFRTFGPVITPDGVHTMPEHAAPRPLREMEETI